MQIYAMILIKYANLCEYFNQICKDMQTSRCSVDFDSTSFSRTTTRCFKTWFSVVNSWTWKHWKQTQLKCIHLCSLVTISCMHLCGICINSSTIKHLFNNNNKYFKNNVLIKTEITVTFFCKTKSCFFESMSFTGRVQESSIGEFEGLTNG